MEDIQVGNRSDTHFGMTIHKLLQARSFDRIGLLLGQPGVDLIGSHAFLDLQSHLLKVLQEMGLEIKEGMTPDEIDAWLAEQQADPVKTARLEKFVDGHPEVRVRSIANLDVLHRNAVSLLDRKDAAVLLLRAEEIEPWVPFLIEKLQL